jgi:hypothetical protein
VLRVRPEAAGSRCDEWRLIVKGVMLDYRLKMQLTPNFK